MLNDRYKRQSFLGDQKIFQDAIVGVIGLGGGGSHIIQQLSHIGFSRFRLYDPDNVEDVNMNRLVGATLADVKNETPKIMVAKRMIESLQKKTDLKIYSSRWQENPGPLKECDLIFGCLDSFSDRRELEVCSRRYLIPYIDIGMDVYCIGVEPPRIAGQVILSMPNGPCMFCLGFLTEEKLAKEASLYGDAGPRPQVIWANGILASAAVGIAVDLLTNWSQLPSKVIYLSYDGNKHILGPHIRLNHIGTAPCPHYPADQIGDPIAKAI